MSGELTYQPVGIETKKIRGVGETRAENWLTIASQGACEASVTIYGTNPVNYTAPQGINIVKTFAIDLIKADTGSIVIRISYNKL